MRTLNGWTVVALLCAATAAPMGFAADEKDPAAEAVNSPEFKLVYTKGVTAFRNGMLAQQDGKDEERLKCMKEASELFEKALKIAPNTYGVQEDLACAYLYSDQFEKAVAAFDVVLPRAKGEMKRANLFCVKAIAHMKQDKNEEAMKDLNEALKEVPRYPLALDLKQGLEESLKSK